MSRCRMKEMIPENTNNCAYYVKRKHRFCKMTVAKDKRFCGEHEPTICNLANGDESEGRIICPLDPKHTVYKRKLEKHLRICNSRPCQTLPPYVVPGINCGNMIDCDDYSHLKLSDFQEQDIQRITEIVTSLHERHIKIETLKFNHPILAIELEKTVSGKNSQKHLTQTSSLLGIMEDKKFIQDDTSFIEFGAGKGQLAFHLAQILNDKNQSQVILLDRMSLRHKKDNKIEDKSLVHRIRVDISDFKMSQLESIQRTKRVVAIGKHLCGAGTDLALRCIVQHQTEKKTNVPVEGILIALCCHHQCDWKSFVGKEFLTSNGLNQRDFAIITKMASWAICGTGLSRERRKELENQSHKLDATKSQVTANLRMTLKEREQIGLMCKRILDYSRLEYLQSHNYAADLKFYVSSDITLENVCLLASKLY